MVTGSLQKRAVKSKEVPRSGAYMIIARGPQGKGSKLSNTFFNFKTAGEAEMLNYGVTFWIIITFKSKETQMTDQSITQIT